MNHNDPKGKPRPRPWLGDINAYKEELKNVESERESQVLMYKNHFLAQTSTSLEDIYNAVVPNLLEYKIKSGEHPAYTMSDKHSFVIKWKKESFFDNSDEKDGAREACSETSSNFGKILEKNGYDPIMYSSVSGFFSHRCKVTWRFDRSATNCLRRMLIIDDDDW